MIFFFYRGLLQAHKKLDVFYRAFKKINYCKNMLRTMEFVFLYFKEGGLVIFSLDFTS